MHEKKNCVFFPHIGVVFSHLQVVTWSKMISNDQMEINLWLHIGNYPNLVPPCTKPMDGLGPEVGGWYWGVPKGQKW